jgi:hypothetical protein
MTRPARRRRVAAAVLAATAAAIVGALALPAPGLAHGADAPDATDYRTRVTQVAPASRRCGDPTTFSPAVSTGPVRRQAAPGDVLLGATGGENRTRLPQRGGERPAAADAVVQHGHRG